jgi:hypothetical protein
MFGDKSRQGGADGGVLALCRVAYPLMLTSQTQANMYISCDRRPIAICPRVTQSKDAQEEKKKELCVSVCPQGDVNGTEEWNAYLWKALAFRRRLFLENPMGRNRTRDGSGLCRREKALRR